MSNKLSVTIITLNEEKYLSSCLESIKEIVDEIVVVDSGSTDKTVDIAEKFGAKVYVRDFDNFANQKNYALEKAAGEWILSLDGDEKIEKELSFEIKDKIRNEEYDAYSIPRKNVIFGKFIKYSRWQPELDRHIWLFRKSRGKWVGDVHEELKVNGKVGELKNAKIHYQYETISQFFIMMNSYSSLEALERFKKGERFSIFQVFARATYNFLVRYFYRLGFLDGWRGFVLSYIMAIYHVQVLIKIWELKKHV